MLVLPSQYAKFPSSHWLGLGLRQIRNIRLLILFSGLKVCR
jgi:hypothetical protein